jgi:hypothetical protein
MEYRLTTAVYTEEAVTAGISAFAHLCSARMTASEEHIVLAISDGDETLHAELLNYVLALSAQALLQ